MTGFGSVTEPTRVDMSGRPLAGNRRTVRLIGRGRPGSLIGREGRKPHRADATGPAPQATSTSCEPARSPAAAA